MTDPQHETAPDPDNHQLWEPEFMALLQRVAAGELTAEEAIRIERQRRHQ